MKSKTIVDMVLLARRSLGTSKKGSAQVKKREAKKKKIRFESFGYFIQLHGIFVVWLIDELSMRN